MTIPKAAKQLKILLLEIIPPKVGFILNILPTKVGIIYIPPIFLTIFRLQEFYVFWNYFI
jgi:hypothetical protein